jgi:hypothetical protein
VCNNAVEARGDGGDAVHVPLSQGTCGVTRAGESLSASVAYRLIDGQSEGVHAKGRSSMYLVACRIRDAASGQGTRVLGHCGAAPSRARTVEQSTHRFWTMMRGRSCPMITRWEGVAHLGDGHLLDGLHRSFVPLHEAEVGHQELQGHVNAAPAHSGLQPGGAAVVEGTPEAHDVRLAGNAVVHDLPCADIIVYGALRQNMATVGLPGEM